MDAQRDTIRQEALKQFSEEHQMKDAEHQKMVTDLKKQIDELKRKAEQGSQQTQGEVQELALEEMLEASFPGRLPSNRLAKVSTAVTHSASVLRQRC